MATHPPCASARVSMSFLFLVFPSPHASPRSGYVHVSDEEVDTETHSLEGTRPRELSDEVIFTS